MEFVVIPLILFLLGSYGYEEEADRVAQVSTHTRNNKQIVEGISRFQFSETGRTRLMYAAMTGNLERLNFIADLGAQVNMTTIDDNGLAMWTALHFATRYGHTECVRSLLDRGAVIDIGVDVAVVPFCLACVYGHLEIVHLLYEGGAQINLQCPYLNGQTALASCTNVDIVRYLCENGANTLLSVNGETPYMRACRRYGIKSPLARFLETYPH